MIGSSLLGSIRLARVHIVGISVVLAKIGIVGDGVQTSSVCIIRAVRGANDDCRVAWAVSTLRGVHVGGAGRCVAGNVFSNLGTTAGVGGTWVG